MAFGPGTAARKSLLGFSEGTSSNNRPQHPGVSRPGRGHAESILARSRDGGRTWTVEDPAHFVGDGGTPVPSPGSIAFHQPGFALRAVGVGYHGSDAPKGSFFYSTDRGHVWQGPFQFTGLMDDANLGEMECTTRTGYLVTGRDSCLIFMSARPRQNGGGRDKTFVAETTDGGKTFHFVSWIVPLVRSAPRRDAGRGPLERRHDRRRAAPPHPGRRHDALLGGCYGSKDNGRTWTFLSRVGETGGGNGNPPALVALKDRRLACAYGDRSRVKLFARLSADGGRTWGEEIVLRDDFQPDKFGDKDFGYPRLVQNNRGELVAMYYWATKDLPQQHITATIWKPENQK